MSIFSFFTAAPKLTDDVFDKDSGLLTKFGGWIDGQQFTEQESVEHSAQTIKDVQKFVVDTLGESTERSKTRRDIAVLVIKFYLLLLFIAVMVFPFNKEWSTFALSVAMIPALGGLVVSIGVFFFGSHLMRGYNESKNKEK
tara:strand:+ start:71 stop:493 length:423 start_codon:yes stop_codon:yes gene_type:complete